MWGAIMLSKGMLWHIKNEYYKPPSNHLKVEQRSTANKPMLAVR